MQIRNDYSYQNQNYEHTHSHNITDCLHDDVKKQQGQIVGNSKLKSSSASYQQQKAATLELSSLIQPESKEAKEKKNGISFVKGFWNSLGEDSGGSAKSIPLMVKENVLSHMQGVIHSAQTAVHSLFQKKMLHSVTILPQKIKMEISTALKKFGRGKEAFTALTEEGMPSGQNAYQKGARQNGQMNSGKEEEIPMAKLPNSHLMDSYSKTGSYCQLNENLTYQKPKERREREGG